MEIFSLILLMVYILVGMVNRLFASYCSSKLPKAHRVRLLETRCVKITPGIIIIWQGI